MVDIRKSSYVKQGAYATREYEQPRHKLREGFGHGKVTARTFGIGSFLNNYELSVDEMALVDPLPLLSPLKPFPDPFLDETRRRLWKDENKVERWPCEFKEAQYEPQKRFHRTGDWMHNWSEYMYNVGYLGAKTMK